MAGYAAGGCIIGQAATSYALGDENDESLKARTECHADCAAIYHRESITGHLVEV